MIGAIEEKVRRASIVPPLTMTARAGHATICGAAAMPRTSLR